MLRSLPSLDAHCLSRKNMPEPPKRVPSFESKTRSRSAGCLGGAISTMASFRCQLPADRRPSGPSKLARETEGMHDEDSDDDDQAHGSICTELGELGRPACEYCSSALFQMKKPLRHQIGSLGAELQPGLNLDSCWAASCSRRSVASSDCLSFNASLPRRSSPGIGAVASCHCGPFLEHWRPLRLCFHKTSFSRTRCKASHGRPCCSSCQVPSTKLSSPQGRFPRFSAEASRVPGGRLPSFAAALHRPTGLQTRRSVSQQSRTEPEADSRSFLSFGSC